METIKSSTEISLLFKEGKRYSRSCITLLARERDKQHVLRGRVAFIAGKKQGNAVWRNKAKRRMRAVCREAGGPWAGFDVVFLAKKSTTNVEYSKVLKTCLDVSRAFR